MLTEAQEPILGVQQALVSGLSNETDFVLFTEGIRRWENPNTTPSSAFVVEFIDSDRDGEFEVIQSTPFLILHENKTWDIRFTVP